jgi:hypothetical protein
MGVTKTDLFTEEQNRLAVLAKAIAHPARIAIIQYCKEQNKQGKQLVGTIDGRITFE